MPGDRWFLLVCRDLGGEPRLSVMRELPRFAEPRDLVMTARIDGADALRPLAEIQARIMAGTIKLWASGK